MIVVHYDGLCIMINDFSTCLSNPTNGEAEQ